jgi:hypothetical protein
LGQSPLMALALALVYFRLPNYSPACLGSSCKVSSWTKLQRIDFLGAGLLAMTIVSALLVFDIAGQKLPWTHPITLTIFGCSLVFGNLFLLVEAFWAKEPIFPLRLLTSWNVITSYLNICFISGAQMAVSSS